MEADHDRAACFGNSGNFDCLSLRCDRSGSAASKMAMDALLKVLRHTEADVAGAALSGLAGSQAGTAAVLGLHEKRGKGG